MNLEALTKKAQATAAEINEFKNEVFNAPLDTADGVALFITGLNRLGQYIINDSKILGYYMAHFNAKRDAPNKSAALDLCDEVLMKLDTLRDLVCRSIEGDDDVICDESSAGLITDLLKSMEPILPQISNLVYVKRGGKQDEDNDA